MLVSKVPMRLLLISLATVFLFVFALLGVRFWGLAIPYQRFDHDFLKQPPFWAVRVTTLNEAKNLVQAEPQVILWLDIRQSLDRRLLVLPVKATEFVLHLKTLGDRWQGDQVYRYDLSELRPLFPEAPLLEDLLKEFPEQRVILNIVDNVADIQLLIRDTLKPFSPEKRVLIQSDTDVILKSLKELQPLWLYGTSWADIMKLLTFDSVGLGPAAPYKGDVFIAPMEISGRPAYNEAVLDEVRRRQKSVFLGPLQNDDEFSKALESKPDGLIFANPELFLDLKSQGRL